MHRLALPALVLAAAGCNIAPNLSAPDASPEEKAAREQAAGEIGRHRDAFRSRVAAARGMALVCVNRDLEQQPPVVRGKLLIWDAAKDDASDAHFRLPADVRATEPSDDLT